MISPLALCGVQGLRPGAIGKSAGNPGPEAAGAVAVAAEALLRGRLFATVLVARWQRGSRHHHYTERTDDLQDRGWQSSYSFEEGSIRSFMACVSRS